MREENDIKEKLTAFVRILAPKPVLRNRYMFVMRQMRQRAKAKPESVVEGLDD